MSWDSREFCIYKADIHLFLLLSFRFSTTLVRSLRILRSKVPGRLIGKHFQRCYGCCGLDTRSTTRFSLFLLVRYITSRRKLRFGSFILFHIIHPLIIVSFKHLDGFGCQTAEMQLHQVELSLELIVLMHFSLQMTCRRMKRFFQLVLFFFEFLVLVLPIKDFIILIVRLFLDILASDLKG